MKRLLVLVLLLGAVAPVPLMAEAGASVRFGKFGEVRLYPPAAQASRVVLFLSDADGWDRDSTAMARALSGGGDTLVIGIDTRHYRKQLAATARSCLYPAGDLEALSQFVQKKLGLHHYLPPLIIGRGAGATLAYAALAQAPANTFAAGVGMNFCPMDGLPRPACQGYGLTSTRLPDGRGYRLEPRQKLDATWRVLHGSRSAACEAQRSKTFVSALPSARWTGIDETGRDDTDGRAWQAALQNTLSTLQASVPEIPQASALAELPLIEVRAKNDVTDTLVVLISGDGGWAGIDRDLAIRLSAEGHSVVGLNALAYFWQRRTPETTSRDLARILRYYFAAWGKQRAILIGYSRGAEVLPFMANRLPPDLLKHTRLVALLGPEMRVEFEFRVQDWLGSQSRPAALPVLPEVEKLRGVPVLCVAGEDEGHSLCRKLEPGLATTVIMKGGHHFGGDYRRLGRIILQAAGE